MFKEAARQAMKNQGRNHKWLFHKTGIPLTSLWAYFGKSGKQLSPARVEAIFKALGITLVIPKD